MLFVYIAYITYFVLKILFIEYSSNNSGFGGGHLMMLSFEESF
jgi:hypothetical protein